VNKKKKR